MKRLVFLLCLCFLSSSGLKAQDAIGQNNKEKKILKLLNSLPEVVKENSQRKKAGVKVLLKAYIQNTPFREHDYFSVSISEESKGRLFTYDWYEVNPRTYEIRWWDIVNTGKTMSLTEWRKQLRRNQQ